MSRRYRLTIGQTNQGIPDTDEARKLDAALEHETDPRILALLREGVLTTEPPDAGANPPARVHHKPSGRVRTMRDMVRERERRQRLRAEP